MRHRKYSDEQVINILREGEAGGKIGELCRKYGMSDASLNSTANGPAKAKSDGSPKGKDSDASPLRSLFLFL